MSKRGDLDYKSYQFRAYKYQKALRGETTKGIILAFTHFRKGTEMSYDKLQTIVLIDTGRKARERKSFDLRLRRLGELGYISDRVQKERDEDGVIIPTRYYSLTKLGRSTLLSLQKERKKQRLSHRRGIEYVKDRRGGDYHTAIRLAAEAASEEEE